MKFLNQTRIDMGKNAVVSGSGSLLTAFYVKGGNAHRAVFNVENSPPALTQKGRYAYCVQAAPLGSREIRVFPEGITIV